MKLKALTRSRIWKLRERVSEQNQKRTEYYISKRDFQNEREGKIGEKDIEHSYKAL
jgi:hypothetical protein